MNPKQLYGYITSQMTAEQALMRLLQSSVMHYEKLKFPKQEEAIHPIILISLAAMDMGWQMAVENKSNEPEAQVKGLVCGTEEYVNKLMKSNNANSESILSKEVVMKAIDDEPEFTEDMPEEMYRQICSSRKIAELAMRRAVDLTKQGIKKRLSL